VMIRITPDWLSVRAARRFYRTAESVASYSKDAGRPASEGQDPDEP